MSGWRLAARGALPAGLDFGGLFSADWTAAEGQALATWAVRTDGGTATIGDLFTVTGAPGPVLTLAGDFAQVRGIGAGLAQGTVVVEGSVGDDAGLEMRGGALVIRGHAGANLGGGRPGAKRGMSGGEIIVFGDAGPEAAARCRRGLVCVTGTVGPRAASAMLAGTLVTFGPLGPDAGRFSKRGSLVALGGVTPGAHFSYACTYTPAVLRMILQRLRAVHGVPVTPAQLAGPYQRFAGDLAEGARGELLAWTPS